MIDDRKELRSELEKCRAEMERMREVIRIDARLIGRLNAELNDTIRGPD
jgi:hypothetical protein